MVMIPSRPKNISTIRMICAACRALCLEPAQLVQRRGHELLPAEARLHAHHQHKVQLVKIGCQRLRGGAGLDGQAHLAAQRPDYKKAIVKLAAGESIEFFKA